jgi:hypothetical protein
VRRALVIGGGIALGAAAGAAAWWLTVGTNPIAELGDLAVSLTTTDEQRLSRLEPETQAAARALINALAAAGLSVKVGQTLRTPAEEKAVIDAGRSAVKTHSWHELGRALDLYPIDPDTGAADLKGARVDLFRTMHDVAAGLGFRGTAFNSDGSKRLITNSAGRKIWDGGHLEYRGPYATIAEAVAAEGAAFGVA